MNPQSGDGEPEVNVQDRVNIVRNLREELSACKCRERLARAYFQLVGATIAITVAGFGWFAYQIIILAPSDWIQLSGFLGLSIVWLCFVAVILRSLGGRR
jgi:hypothetical protein